MTLKQYLTSKNIGVNEFARRAGLDAASISRLASGQQTGLHLETAAAIVRASRGAISFKDLLKPSPPHDAGSAVT